MTKHLKNRMRITITIMPTLNKILEDLSAHSQQSKSRLIERAVEEFLKKKLDEDSKKLSKIKFSDLPNENEWLLLQK